VEKKMGVMLVCTNCGKEAPKGSSFCPFCGMRSTDTSPSPTVPTPASTVPLPPSAVEVPISYIVQTAVISFDQKASRLELFVRILWSFFIGIIGFIYGLIFGIIIFLYSIVAGILNLINFFIVLITGKRWKTAFVWQAKLIQKMGTYYPRLYNFTMRRAPYFGLMTDRRPTLEMEPTPSTTSGGSPA
jgi:hypothetical protein